jgi:protein O-mannosyl-transferase
MRVAIPIIVFVVAILAFLPALQNDFVDWDDDALFLNNPDYRGLGIDQITWMFTHAKLGHYQPITWLTHGLDYCLWGMNPFGYHLSNLIYHAACAVLVYFLAVRIFILSTTHSAFSLKLAAALAALLFALHPLRVESVAWVTERRDLVCTLFLIPAVLCYLRYAAGPGDPLLWYCAALVLYVFSLLSKAWGITLPAVLLILDLYPLRRLKLGPRVLFIKSNLSVLLEKIPFAITAFLTAQMALHVQSFAGMESLTAHTPIQRLAQAAYGLIFYIAKSLVPINLNPIYEFPIPFDPFAPRFIIAAIILVTLVATVIALRRRIPSLLAACAIYAVILSPVLGFTQTGPQLVADRYSYLACIPLALLAASVLIRYSALRIQHVCLAIAVLLVLSILTWRQCRVWRNSHTLWQHSIALDPHSCNARSNLGFLLTREKRFDEAAVLFQSCLDRRPDDPLFLMNLAAAQKALGQTGLAIDSYRRALALRPKDTERLLMLAQAFIDTGDLRRAVEAARLAIETDPAEPRAHYAAGQALSRLGDVSAATQYLKKTIELLEPRLPPGLDPNTDLRAAMHANACAILSEYFEKQRDFDQAAIYRDKSMRLRGL